MKLTIQQCFDVPLLDSGIQGKPWIAAALTGPRDDDREIRLG